ncbi:alpha/beta fold hydrolase [Kineococcus indalonis]|uniref:alpha/beta fold hydrolase n=1 Tax=Kineococcus indalonis TaxID=2696566 RepID=UPI00196AE588|nr:alpha/beta fold hydrolase [Kineococcus indalonis]
MTAPLRPASLPPAGLPGLDPRWSRLVQAPDSAGVPRTWHLLDTAPGAAEGEVAGTLVCVHGNPTWSYLWRHLAAAASAAPVPWRVVAVDQLEMGFSERTGVHRTLAQRTADLANVMDALELTGPVVAVGQDWGGIVVTGWAAGELARSTGEGAGRHRAGAGGARLAGLVVANTAASYPADAPAPGALRAATLPGVLPLVTRRADLFLRTTLELPKPRLAADVRAAYRLPYRTAQDRAGVEDFVADVPVGHDHPSRPALDAVGEGVEQLRAAGVPALVVWGPRDPVFGERFLRDWRRRLPRADVHRLAGASHLVPEDDRFAPVVLDWLGERVASAPGGADATGAGDAPGAAAADGGSDGPPRLWAALEERSGDEGPAVVEVAADGTSRAIGWSLLARRTRELAAGLQELGVLPGQRVSLLVPPGADLTAALYAVLRVGAVAVVADAGLGVRGLTRAVTGSGVDWVVGVPRALAAARALRWPGRRIAAGPVGGAALRATGAEATLLEVAELGRNRLAGGTPLPPEPAAGAEGAVLFTSGSTGPAKGVVYTHAQLARLATAMGAVIRTGPGHPLVSAFAPFALFGPALGATCVVPAMDVTKPATLTARALADAVAAGGATSAFLAPAAVVNVLATADALDAPRREALAGVRVLLSAGAPVPTALLQRVRELMPLADPRTPYGATEVLPATDVSLSEVLEAGEGEGTCVGRPVPGVVVGVAPLDADGRASEEVSAAPGVTGEVVVGGEHVKDRYDQLWGTTAASVRVRPDAELAGALGSGRWHRTGDVGHLDEAGRVWVEGRLAHVVVTADEVVTPVGVEQRAERVAGIARAALVGVGPRAARQLVVVAEAETAVTGPVRRTTVAPPPLARQVRRATGRNLAAVLLVPALPTDVRHNSKIDRVRVAAWAERVLAGDRAGRLA